MKKIETLVVNKYGCIIINIKKIILRCSNLYLNKLSQIKGYKKTFIGYEKKQGFWLYISRNLEYLKPKYFNYEIAINYKICVKKHKYNLYKVPKKYNFINYFKSCKCNN